MGSIDGSGYPERALQILKARGYRLTQPRRLVLETLDVAALPLSAYEIADRIREQGERGEVASVYRILETLEENDLIHRVLASGKYAKCQLGPEADCQRHQKQHCHHSLVCRGCGRTEEFHCPGVELIEQVVVAHSSFTIERHALEFSGLCGSCQTA